MEHYPAHALSDTGLFEVLGRVTCRTDDNCFLDGDLRLPLAFFIVIIGISVCQNPVKPALQLCRTVTPPDRIDERKGIGPVIFSCSPAISPGTGAWGS